MIFLAACGSREHAHATAPPITDAIARDVSARLALPATVSCDYLLGMPTACRAGAGGATIPIEITLHDRAWDWRFDGVVISTQPIAKYIRAMLGTHDLALEVSCAPDIRRVTDEPIECTVGPGKAFVTLRADGSVADVELELDPAAAAARSIPMAADELEKLSKELKTTEDEADDQ